MKLGYVGTVQHWCQGASGTAIHPVRSEVQVSLRFLVKTYPISWFIFLQMVFLVVFALKQRE